MICKPGQVYLDLSLDGRYSTAHLHRHNLIILRNDCIVTLRNTSTTHSVEVQDVTTSSSCNYVFTISSRSLGVNSVYQHTVCIKLLVLKSSAKTGLYEIQVRPLVLVYFTVRECHPSSLWNVCDVSPSTILNDKAGKDRQEDEQREAVHDQNRYEDDTIVVG